MENNQSNPLRSIALVLPAALFGAAEGISAPYKDAIRFTLTSFLLNLSRLYKYRDSGGGQPTGNYYIPQVNRENEA